MIPDRAGNVESWELDALITILLRQFKRLLAERDVDLRDHEMRHIGEQFAAGELDPTQHTTLIAALKDIVVESEDVLAGWNLTYTQSLRTEMTDLTWETTADFLEIANEKVNAELRIAAGSTLLTALGERTYAQNCIIGIEYDLETEGSLDVDAMMAKKVLLFVYDVTPDDPNWLGKIKGTSSSTK